ncbi:DUF3592 domain-containing protein [Granulicella cerasi]|uniref:DUF3592 domain-containing protein n=1 Tax=Granulicella cerasi TaxID=741063 RepID=A0ABW1ZA70_9BACT|nr:hypothetical protein [Granulicella cerasi]
MRPSLHNLAPILHRHNVQVGTAIGVGSLAAVIGGIWLVQYLRRPSAAEVERRRREQLGRTGRITDGVIVDSLMLNGDPATVQAPEVLVYSYQLSGVTYNCAQDVSMLHDKVQHCRLDQPVQVRYDTRYPGNSIIVTEEWSGIWAGPISKSA